jgi:uncharacterized repeat protein (TIGR03803 family)
MRSKNSPVGVILVLAIIAATLFVPGTHAAAQQEKLLHSFNINGKDGVNPISGVIFDAAGNLYGTTLSGGTHNEGMVFELSPLAGGGWAGAGRSKCCTTSTARMGRVPTAA